MARNAPAFQLASERVIRALGVPVTVQRGTDAPLTVTALPEDGQSKVGQRGQIVGRQTLVEFIKSDFSPERGDMVTIDGTARKVEAIDSDDGIVVVVVLHG